MRLSQSSTKAHMFASVSSLAIDVNRGRCIFLLTIARNLALLMVSVDISGRCEDQIIR